MSAYCCRLWFQIRACVVTMFGASLLSIVCRRVRVDKALRNRVIFLILWTIKVGLVFNRPFAYFRLDSNIIRFYKLHRSYFPARGEQGGKRSHFMQSFNFLIL